MYGKRMGKTLSTDLVMLKFKRRLAKSIPDG